MYGFMINSLRIFCFSTAERRPVSSIISSQLPIPVNQMPENSIMLIFDVVRIYRARLQQFLYTAILHLANFC